MQLKSKTTPFILIGVTSLIISRAMFMFFNDPEGPNLVVVIGMAAIFFFLSLTAYSFNPSKAMNIQKLLLAILIQVLLAAASFFFLR